MPEVKCVEPALVDQNPGSNYVCLVKAEDTLVFPHVDVCMGAVWITTRSWQMIGGHVPGKWDENSGDDLQGCANRVFTEMDRRWSERSVDIVITIGDPSGFGAPAWTEIVQTMVRNLSPAKYLMIWKDTPGGADLKVEGPAAKLIVSSSRTGQLILERTFASIAREEKPIRYDVPILFKTTESWKAQFKDEPFKGLEPFDPALSVQEQTRIKNLFKEIFQHHGACTVVEPPRNSGLTGQAVFKFADGEKVIFDVTLVQHPRFTDRYQIRNITSLFRKYGAVGA